MKIWKRRLMSGCLGAVSYFILGALCLWLAVWLERDAYQWAYWEQEVEGITFLLGLATGVAYALVIVCAFAVPLSLVFFCFAAKERDLL